MNPQKTLCLFFFLALCINGMAQPRNAFSYISKPAELEADMEALVGEKYEKARAIYDKLVEAKGDRRFPVPAFTMTKETNNAAFLVYGGTQIGLEEKAYDICMSMGEAEGEAAVAGLLGHELIHFYEKHQWRSGFAQAYSELEIGRRLRGMVDQDKVNNETQADYLGGFLAYSAGYDVFDNRGALLDKIYTQYPFPEVDSSGAYPSLDDRKALARKSEEKLKELVSVFEVGNLLTAVGQYEDARAFYKHILIDYQGREIYNNLGVVTVLEALEFFPQSERKYRLPLELDMSFGAGGKDGFGDKIERRNKLLREAILYFNNAIGMDPGYAPAYLNKACAYYMLEDNKRAAFYAGVEAQRDTSKYPKTATDAKVLLAMLAAKAGNAEEAIAQLEQLETPSAVARYNLSVMKVTEAATPAKPDGPDAYDIDGVDPFDLTTFDRQYRRQRQEIELFGALDFRIWNKSSVDQLTHSTVYMVKSPNGTNTYLQLTDAAHPGELYDGFKAGTSRAEMVDLYGEPNTSLELPTGEIMVYKEVLLLLDQDGKLERWANYSFD
jgi:tetratricopeptide (TPR) repeat protein